MEENLNPLQYNRKAEEIPGNLFLKYDFPVKLTFLKSLSGPHIFGIYEVDDNGFFKNPKIAFPNLAPDSLIPTVSSFALPKDYIRKKISFFLINNGFSLNQNIPDFSNLTGNKNGSLFFFERSLNWKAIPAKEKNGEIFWIDRENHALLEKTKPASLESKNPVLIWDSETYGPQILAGHIFHTIAKGDCSLLNPDGFQHAAIYFDNAGDSLTIGFCDILKPESALYNNIRLKLLIGEENFMTLYPESFAPGLSLKELANEQIKSLNIKIVAGRQNNDRLRPWALFLDENGQVEDTSITLTNIDQHGCLLLQGKDSFLVYESVLEHIRLINLNKEEENTPRTISLTIKTNADIHNWELKAFPNASASSNYSVNIIKKSADKIEEKLHIKPALPMNNINTTKNESLQNQNQMRPTPLAAAERKTVLITGAAKRIGKEIALGFAKDGWNVIIHCNNSIAEARELAREIGKCKVRTALLQADLEDENEVVQIFPQIFSVFEKVDCLINCAAVFEKDSFDSVSLETWNKHMMINLRAPFLLMQDFAAQFASNDGSIGNIINITDQKTVRPNPAFFSYTLSKCALADMTKMVALALAPNIRVNAIAPGIVLPSPEMNAKEMEAKIATLPLKQKTNPLQIYNAIKFILNTDALTGETIIIDGGQHL